MDVIDELRADVRHDFDCRQIRVAGTLRDTDNECSDFCSYRRKIAFLDRLREPSELLRQVWALPAEYGLTVGEILGGRDENDEVCEAVENLLAAMEETK